MKIDFIFDFASPNAYCCHKVIPDVEKRTGAKFNYIHCLLGGIFKSTNNLAPMIKYSEIKNRLEYEGVEMKRFMDKHNLDKFRMNSNFPITTVTLQRGALVADEMGFIADYRDKVLTGMWENDVNLGDHETLKSFMKNFSIDHEHFFKEIASEKIKQRLFDNTNMAVERGSFGVPTFFVNDQIFFGKDKLLEIENYIYDLEKN